MNAKLQAQPEHKMAQSSMAQAAVPSPAPPLLEPVKMEGSDDDKETELLPAEQEV